MERNNTVSKQNVPGFKETLIDTLKLPKYVILGFDVISKNFMLMTVGSIDKKFATEAGKDLCYEQFLEYVDTIEVLDKTTSDLSKEVDLSIVQARERYNFL